MSFWSDFFQRELIIRVASTDLMDLVLVVFFAIPTSFQNYPKGYLLRKRVAIIILSLSKRLLSTLPSRTYMSPHVLAPCQELFPNPISLISPSPSFSAHHFQIDRSYIVKKCWFPSWFSQLHDVPVSKALRCFKAVASSCWCGADLCNQGCSSNSLAERRRLGSTFSSRSITSLASWETPSQSSME